MVLESQDRCAVFDLNGMAESRAITIHSQETMGDGAVELQSTTELDNIPQLLVTAAAGE